MTVIEVMGFVLRQTCWACPDQWEATRADEPTALIHLRSGRVRVCNDVDHLEDDPVATWRYGDEWTGEFEDDRDQQLAFACGVLHRHRMGETAAVSKVPPSRPKDGDYDASAVAMLEIPPPRRSFPNIMPVDDPSGGV